MKAIYKHELKMYFNGVYAYVFSAFILLFIGIYCSVYNLNYAYPFFEYVLGSMDFVFIIVVPILTMRVLAEERREKTDQLLYSLPLRMSQIIIGKYLAMMTVLALPVAITCFYPLILTSFGTVSLTTAYSSVAGFFFLAAGLMAIGMFISSLTENQAVSAGICFAVMLLNYFMASLAGMLSDTAFTSFAALTILIIIVAVIVWLMTKHKLATFGTGIILEIILVVFYVIDSTKFEGLFADIMEDISLFSRFDVFIDGVFDITGIVYFLTVTGVFLFFSVQSMERRRWN